MTKKGRSEKLKIIAFMFSNDGTSIFSPIFFIAIFIIIQGYSIQIQILCFSNYFVQNVGHITQLYPILYLKGPVVDWQK
jgi:hypothetical protein